MEMVMVVGDDGGGGGKQNHTATVLARTVALQCFWGYFCPKLRQGLLGLKKRCRDLLLKNVHSRDL